MTEQATPTPITAMALLIKAMESLPENEVRQISTSIDWGSPEVLVLRSRNECFFQYHSKVDILIEKASERLIGWLFDPAMLDHTDSRPPDSRTRTRWGTNIDRDGLWASACMQALYSGKTQWAKKCFGLLPASQRKSLMVDLADAGAQGGHKDVFAFLLSQDFLDPFMVVKAPEATRNKEAVALKNEMVDTMAVLAPLAKLKTLAGLLGGHLPARCVKAASKVESKPHRAFAVARLVAMEEGASGKTLPPEVVECLKSELVGKPSSARDFSTRSRWVLSLCPAEQISYLVDGLAKAGALWDAEVLEEVRARQPKPGASEMSHLIVKADEAIWSPRLAEALASWDNEDFELFRLRLEDTVQPDTQVDQDPTSVAGRLAAILGASHGCVRFEKLLVQRQKRLHGTDTAQASITQAIMNQVTGPANACPKARRL